MSAEVTAAQRWCRAWEERAVMKPEYWAGWQAGFQAGHDAAQEAYWGINYDSFQADIWLTKQDVERRPA